MSKKTTTKASVAAGLKAALAMSNYLAGLISKAEYEADELQKGLPAWDEVAQTMRDGSMAAFHAQITDALKLVEKEDAYVVPESVLRLFRNVIATAKGGLSHVGQANYQERQNEAWRSIHTAEDRLYEACQKHGLPHE